MSAPYLALKKHKGKDRRALRDVARHNLRKIPAELGKPYNDIDPARTHLNVILAGPAYSDDVLALSDRLLAESGAAFRRKDAVCGIEILCSLPPDTEIDPIAYFTEVTRWAGEYFKVPILSSVIHLDEPAPHCHILLLPIWGKRTVGSKLVGYKGQLHGIQTDFYHQVASKYGLSPQGRAGRLSPEERGKGAEIAYTSIVSDPDLLLLPAVERELRRAIVPNPEPLLRAMGIGSPLARGLGTP